MQSRKEHEAQADALLASYAVTHAGSGRGQDESEDDTRLRFQRDRGRIVHTQAFRRLKGKTQVFVGGGGDHYRTRLTHTLEVAGISRDIARALNLNEDLAECIALAHDLGHPPFGHAGEYALDQWMQKHKAHFEHNIQSHRIVTILEDHSALHTGLNLNQEVLDGLLKHSTPHDHPDEALISHGPSLEAQVVNLADEIAYTAHDCEDGLRAELFTLDAIRETSLAKESDENRQKRGTSLRGSIIHMLVLDLFAASEKQLESEGIATLDNVYACDQSLIIFSEDMRSSLDELRAFLWKEMYNHDVVLKRAEAGQSIVRSLCDHYFDHPSEKIEELQNKADGTLQDAVKDYVAGMTDSYAFLQAEKNDLLDEEAGSILAHH